MMVVYLSTSVHEDVNDLSLSTLSKHITLIVVLPVLVNNKDSLGTQ